MPQPVARVGDMHVCPMVTGLIPHIGGPITTGGFSVLVAGQPTERVGALDV